MRERRIHDAAANEQGGRNNIRFTPSSDVADMARRSSRAQSWLQRSAQDRQRSFYLSAVHSSKHLPPCPALRCIAAGWSERFGCSSALSTTTQTSTMVGRGEGTITHGNEGRLMKICDTGHVEIRSPRTYRHFLGGAQRCRQITVILL